MLNNEPNNNAGKQNEPIYDKLQLKPSAPNQPAGQIKTLQQRLEDYKKDPTGKPWEDAFNKLLKEEQNPGNFC